MSIILDALKKAEDERKREQGTITYGKTPPRKKSHRRLALTSAGIVVAAGLILLLFFMAPRPSTTVQTVTAPNALSAAKADRPADKPAVQEKPVDVVPGKSLTAQVVIPSPPRGPAVGKEAKKPLPLPLKSSTLTLASAPRGTGRDIASTRSARPRAREEKRTAQTPTEVNGRERVVLSKMERQDAERLFGEARHLEEAGRIGEAKSTYSRILKEYPDHVETLNNLGTMALNQGNPKEALFFFRKILEVRKEYPKVYNNAGLALMMEGNVRLAEEYFRQAIQLDRQGLEPYVNLAAVLRKQRRLEEAGRLLEIPISRNLGSPTVSLSYALIKDELGQKGEASRFYRQALREGLMGEERTRVTERLRFLEQEQPAPSR